MTTQNIKTPIITRLLGVALLFVLVFSAAASAQIVVTVTPAAQAQVRKADARAPVNPFTQLTAVAAHNQLDVARLRAAGRLRNAAALSASESDNAAEKVAARLTYRKGEQPVGATPAELSAELWQWLISIPLATNPGSDKIGEFAGIGQRGKFWFLPGNNGGVDLRTITLPADTSLFLPVFTALFFDDGTSGPVPEAEVRALLDEIVGHPTDLLVSVDFEALPRSAIQRVQSDVFTTVFPEHNILSDFDVPAGVYDISLADTYYVLLKPLTPGKHTVIIRGATADFYSQTEYYINVVPPSGALVRDAAQQGTHSK